MQLVDALSGIPGPEATRALVDRALFDIASQVRNWAVVRLAARDREEYEISLLRAFRYPLPAVSFHAAEALVALGDVHALPSLKKLLEQPNPSAPFVGDDRIWRMTELVRVNHHRNCLLCHPRSHTNRDQVRSAIPHPHRPLTPTYPGARVSGEVVRADITYLRQDFSILQPVADHGPWPELQRFDYFLRARPLTEDEQRSQVDPELGLPKHGDDYPQREAVRLAIAGLSKILDGDGELPELDDL
jgi:hypothetical protein